MEEIESEYFNDDADTESHKVAAPIPITAVGANDERLLSSREAAEKIGLTARGLNGMAKNGEVSHYKLGREYRYLLKDLMALIRRVEKS